MVSISLDDILPELFLCDKDHVRFGDLLLCMWDTEPSRSDWTFTVYTEKKLEGGVEFELDGVRWIVVGRGNGAIVRPAGSEH